MIVCHICGNYLEFPVTIRLIGKNRPFLFCSEEHALLWDKTMECALAKLGAIGEEMRDIFNKSILMFLKWLDR